MSLANVVGDSQSLPVVSALRVAAASLLLFASSLYGCAPSADDPSSRLSTWEAPSGEFRIRYLSPPWELSDPAMPLFRIQSNANLAGGVDGGPGKFELRVMTQGGEVFTLMADEVRRAGTTVREPPRTVETLEGVVGQELLTFQPMLPIERYRRIVLFPLAPGRVLRIELESTPDPDTPEVDAMISHVGIGPSP